MKAALFLMIAVALSTACSRERARAVAPAANESDRSPSNYLAIVERARDRQETGDGLVMLEAAKAAFMNDRGRLPSNIQELVSLRYLEHIPPPPLGTRYRYERETGTFDLESLSPSSPDPAGDPITAPSLLRQPD